MEWISVKERLPENGQIVLFHEKSGFIYCAEYVIGPDGASWCIDHYDFEANDVTHWAQLPEPPEVTE